jgi:hypothetical protein
LFDIGRIGVRRLRRCLFLFGHETPV